VLFIDDAGDRTVARCMGNAARTITWQSPDLREPMRRLSVGHPTHLAAFRAKYLYRAAMLQPPRQAA